MPVYILTMNGEPVGRVTFASDKVAGSVASAMLAGSRFELSGGFVHTKPEPSLLELVLSPLPKEERK